jgi:hypothetical protein
MPISLPRIDQLPSTSWRNISANRRSELSGKRE